MRRRRTLIALPGPYGKPRFVEIRLHQWRLRFERFNYRMHRKKRRAFLRKVIGRELAPHEAEMCNYLNNVPDAISHAMMTAWYRREAR